MSETNLQRRLQKLITSRGGYVGKNHGNMITEKGRADLSFTYNGLSFYWEVKTPEGYRDLLRMKKNDTLDARAQSQGIHCRLAKKAGAITNIIYDIEQPELLLNAIDVYLNRHYGLQELLERINMFIEERGLDDGTSY